MMQSPSAERTRWAASCPPASGGSDGKTVIETRFGTIEFDRGHSIRFARPIPGFPNHEEFGLAAIPNVDPNSFMLLQSLAPADLSFVVVPYEPATGLIDQADLVEALQQLDIKTADAAMMLIATFRKEGGRTVTSLNLRAPIIIDTRRRLAWQHILPNDRYPIRHVVGA